jgi:hypothetical protein
MEVLDKATVRKVLASRGKTHLVGWDMTPEEAGHFFKKQGKIVLTFIGYSIDYEDEPGMLKLAHDVLAQYLPTSTLVNIGATEGGVGAVYPLAKSLGFTTTGIVSTQAHPAWVCKEVDFVCFIGDDTWGGKLPSGELSPTSQAIVESSDIIVAIGGGPISRDEVVAGKELGKRVIFYPAELNHEVAIQRAEKRGVPVPTSFWGEAHEVFHPPKTPIKK